MNFSLVSVDLKLNPFVVAGLTVTGLSTVYGVYKFIQYRVRVANRDAKCVFITGCDTGIGRALAKFLDESGVTVFAGCLTETGAKTLKEECSDAMFTIQLDVTDEESVKRAYDFVKKNLPKGKVLWGVVNNAGIGLGHGPVEFSNKKIYETVMKVNFFGPVQVVNTFLPQLKRSAGRVVNLCSGICLVTLPGAAPYTASKYALYGFTEVLRKEKAIWGIKVACIMPGWFKTGITDQENLRHQLDEQLDQLPEDVRDDYGDDYLTEYKKMRVDVSNSFSQPNLSPVLNAIEHALFARYPQAQYRPGFSMGFYKSVPESLLMRMFSPRAQPRALRQVSTTF